MATHGPKNVLGKFEGDRTIKEIDNGFVECDFFRFVRPYCFRRLPWIIDQSAVSLFCAILIGFLAEFSHCSAQDHKSSVSALKLAPNRTCFFSLDRSGSTGSLKPRTVRDNIELPLDQIRFLTDPVIQEEMDLSELESKELEKLGRLLKQFELETKWNRFSKPTAVKNSALSQVEEIAAEFAALKEDDRLRMKSWQRLEQIRLQFRCLGTSDPSKPKSLVEQVKSRLQLTSDQIVKIRQITEEELGDQITFAHCIDEINSLLNGSQRELLARYTAKIRDRKIALGVSIAHCKEFNRYEVVESKRMQDDNEFDGFLMERVVVVLNGSLSVEPHYLERGSYTCVPKPWRNVLKSVLKGEINWLEISDEQLTELGALKKVVRAEDGRNRTLYHGVEKLKSAFEFTPKSYWSVERFEDWKGKFRDGPIAADNAMRQAIKGILVPRQIDEIQLGMAISKFYELGAYHVVEKYLPQLELTIKQKEKMVALRDSRLKELTKIFKRIHRKCRLLLAKKQLDLVNENLGEPVASYPCFWVFIK